MCRNDIGHKRILSKTLAITEMTEIGRQLFRSDASPCFNNGVTLAHFQLSGNIPKSKDLLKRSHRETEIRLAHSLIILAEITSRPVALDLHNLFRCEKTIQLLVEEKLNLLLFSFILLI